MAGRYDLRSQQEVDRSAYASLPGTASMQFITHNMTPMKSKLSPGREVIGCHPGRWIYELTHNSFTVCDLFDRARHANLSTPLSWQHPHRLVVNGCQTMKPKISAVCLDCHFHFVFTLTHNEEHSEELCRAQRPCWPVQDADFLWHHLVWVGSDSETNIAKDSSKYYPLLAREFFICSAPPCTFELTLEVSQPRMSASWIKLLQDHDAIRAQLQICKEQEPARFDAASEDWVTQAPLNLNTYLKNLLEATSPEEVRSISKRNKRFAVCFGPRCFEIFRQLEFMETTRLRGGIDEGSFTPPAPEPPSGPQESTEIGTYRAFLEDVRTEIQCLIHNGGQSPEKPTFCLPLLCSSLGCERPNLEANPAVNAEKYKLLGILPDSRKEVVVNAYKRQWDLLPSKRKALIEALLSVANDVGDEELIDYAMMQSSVFESQLQRECSDDDDGVVSQAMTFLGLVPSNTLTATELVEAFRAKLINDPADASTARSMLSLIAQVSKDDAYRAVLLMETDTKMSLTTAKTILGLLGSSGFGPETLETARAKIKLSTTNDEAALYIDAIEAIAEHTHSTDLKSAVNDMRRERGISSLLDDGSSATQRRAPNFDLPVGLENIGNTCYLNSLLQYLFTVKPVREIALNYESFKLDLTNDGIKGRLLGGNKMQMDRGEAVVAQAFAQELSNLFGDLLTSDKVATRPSQRLANAVLLSTHTLLNNPKQTTESNEARKPPPLPARPPPTVPPKPVEDVVMVSGVDATSEVCDATSSDSSTLVDANDDDSDHSYEKVEKVSTMEDAKTTATRAEQSNEDIEMKDIQSNPVAADPPELAAGGDATNEKAQEESDVKMSEPEESDETVDQKVLTALEHQKRSSGTDQQDVEEVMGSILNRLQAAIRPSGVDKESGIQMEKIMETFFVTTINYTKKFDEQTYQQEISFDRSITAFPALEGSCSLYDALGRNFDQQIIEESRLSRYTAIKTLPPVLHVLIQRSQSMGSKNGNPVVIPETLYLDRYMDCPQDDPVFQARVEGWMIENRISDVREQTAKVWGEPTGPFLRTYRPPSQRDLGAVQTSAFLRNFDFDGPIEDDFMLVSQPRPSGGDTGSERGAAAVEPPAFLEDIEDAEAFIREMMDKEVRHREEVLQDHYAHQTKIPYRLHAVICHRGQLVSGHYWVWIHDFEKDVWRKYNDSNVEENGNTEEVLKTLSTSGEPYFLCYVRDGDKDEYVDVPSRQVKPEPVEAHEDVDAEGDVILPSIETDVQPQTERKPKAANEEKPQSENGLPPPYSES